MQNERPKLLAIISLSSGIADQSDKAIWQVPAGKFSYIEIRNDYWSATFGGCQAELSQMTSQSKLLVDFSQVCWIDPLPLMSIFIAIKTFCARTKSSLILLLGAGTTSEDIRIRGGFLKFISQHGFLSSLKGIPTIIKHDGESFSPQDMEALQEKLSSSLYAMAYPDSLCLEALIEPVTSFQREEDVSAITSNWINSVKESRMKGFFEGETDLLVELIDKIHILLDEIILNAGEHAYDSKKDLSNCYIGIYARLREHDRQDTKLWLEKNGYISSEKKCCPGFSGFDLGSRHSTWLEIFYLDHGRGLLADVNLWKEKARGKLKSKLSGMLSDINAKTNKLYEVGKLLFQEPLSRHDRAERTVLTGLQYVRHALSDKDDWTGVYTAGEWLGARLPWSQDTMEKSVNIGKQNKYLSQDNVARISVGTAWHFCLDLDHVLSANNDQRMSEWDRITSSDVESANISNTQYKDWEIIDDRGLGFGAKSRPWKYDKLINNYILWTPSIVRKNIVHQWIFSLINKEQKIRDKLLVWIIADVSIKDANLLDAVITSTKYNGRRNDALVIILTRDWYVKCFKSIKDKYSGIVFKHDINQTQLAIKKRGSFIFNLLRDHDSKIFWDNFPGAKDGKSDPAFIKEKIIWERNDKNRPKVILKGYLDLTQALLVPERLAVARRALERIWHLHANKSECVAADPLLTNLLPREARLSLNESQGDKTGKENKQVVVSSVYVTGSTAKRATKAGQLAIHLLRHTEIKGVTAPPVSSLFALNWRQGPVEVIKRPKGLLPYERIPGTPYISRGGPKAAPIRRFIFDNESDCFTKSFYGKNPQETYNEMLRFGLLKIGHWVYGPHHDLLTLNLGGCAETKRFYKNTAIEWLLKQLEDLGDLAKSKGSKIIVVYSSHSVTEKMVNAVKSLAYERDTQLPIFIPVHFLASHTQTAIRIPSLTYDRIRRELRDDQGARLRKKVVLLDDGTVTGKVERELEQLVRNAGADEVIHVGLVTRTGLPLYRKYLDGAYKNTHRYYWRWDVPPLGNARTCPLCRAIDQARELGPRMWSKAAVKEVDYWVKSWEATSVATHWRRHGLNPGSLPHLRPITFGKEWLPGKKPVKYLLNHTTSTGLTATIMEIIRTTSYMDVGLKLAREPWGDGNSGDKTEWRDTKLELLISQLLIYFDDFTEQEIQERFRLLLEVMLEPEPRDSNTIRTHQLERLGCLSLLLATEKQAKHITKELWKLLNNSQCPKNHLLSIVGILMRRSENFKDLLNEIPTSDLEISAAVKIKSFISIAHFYGQGEEVSGTRHAIFSLVLLLGEDESRNHTGFLRKKLISELPTNKEDISRDLCTLEQSLREIDTHVLTDTEPSTFYPQEQADSVRKHISLLEKDNGADNYSELLSAITDSVVSMGGVFRDNFIMTPEKIRNFIATSIGYDKWAAKVHKNSDIDNNRWVKNGEIILPNVYVDMNNVIDLDGVFVVFPPIARRMVRDYLYNVVHSSHRINDNGLNCDIFCSLSIVDDH